MKGTFAAMHPFSCLVYLVTATALGFITLHPVFLFCNLAGAFAYALICKACGGLVKQSVLVVTVIIAMGIVNCLFSHYGVTRLFRLGGNYVTLEAFLYGVLSGGVLAGVILWSACIQKNMHSNRLQFVVGRVSPRLALMLSMVLRLVPLYKRRLEAAVEARRALTGEAVRVKQTAEALSAVTTWALESSITTGDSMRSRGYGSAARGSYLVYRFGALDWAYCVFCAVVIFALVFGRGALYFEVNPVVILEAPTAGGSVVMAVYGVFCLLPALQELIQSLIWKYRLR